MAEPQDDWQSVEQPKDDWQPVAPPPREPLPAAFADRVGAGEDMRKAYDEVASKPYSQRIKEWSAAELKQGGAAGYAGAALGTLAATAASVPEMMASGITLARDALTGKVLTGPGLRKEDFSDDPNAPEPLDTLIQRSQDMAMTGGVRESPAPMVKAPLLATPDGQFARPYMAPDGTARAQVVGPPPVEADFKRSAEILGGEHTEANLKQAWQQDGIHPAEAVHDAQTDAFLRHDLTSRDRYLENELVKWINGGSRGEVANIDVLPEAVERFGEPLTAEATFYRGEHHLAPSLSSGERNPSISVSDFEGGFSFSMAKNEGLLEDLLFGDREGAIPISEIIVPEGTKILDVSKFGDKPEEAEKMLPRGTFSKVAERTETFNIGGDEANRKITTYRFEPEAQKAHSLSAAATDAPTDIPLSEQPAPPAGRISESLKAAGDRLFDIGRDAQQLVAPMATGTRDSMAIAKDFANSLRRNRWEWSRIDDDVAGRFTPEQRKRMWDAADEESVMRQEGQQSEHMGLATLEPAERAAVEDLQGRAQNAWLRARDLGMVEGEGLPAYTPRMVINAAGAIATEKALPLNGIGQNLRTRTPQMLKRKYLTAEETEAAAKALLGDQAELARDIRVLPLATAKLEDAITGRTLINAIKDYGKRTGADTVTEGGIPAGSDHKWFTLDHPAFRTWRPKFKEKEGGGAEVVKDKDGNTIFEQVPVYVHGDFEGPLRAVLSEKSGALYGAMMSLKGKTMSLIMNSPLIHNAVEWGRALPAMPGKVATFKVYFEGNRFKNNVPEMKEAIDNGLVPIGHRFFKQDITSIMEAPDLAPGRSLTSKILSAMPGLFDEGAGTAVKRAIDKAGNFWHNTMLWDRVGDLQAGLYVNFRDDMLAKGIDRQTASRMAAHFANRFAGSLPQEAMSNGARKVANMLLFSRTFTLGNLGVLKDMFTGLPKDVMSQIERDAGFKEGAIAAAEEGAPADVAKYAKGMARRKAMAVIATDMAMFYVGNSVLQSALNVMLNDGTLEKEYHGYVQRFQEALTRTREHPLSLLQPLHLAENLSATSRNEPNRQDRLLVGYAKDGTAIYARNPAGKIGEEFIGYMTGPLDMMRRKLGTIARPAYQIYSNDKGFGRKVYDPNADTPWKWVKNAVAIAEHIAASQVPAGQLSAFGDLVKGEGDAKVNALQAFGPVAGITFSKGAPGGPAVGEMYHAREMHDYQVQSALPDIRRQIQRGEIDQARQRMTELGIPPGLQKFYVRTTVNPATRLSPRTLRDFYLYATPEQRQRLETAR